MLNSLLVGLDGSEGGRAVVELGLRWARRHDALAVGLAVVDEPGIYTSEPVLYAGAHSRRHEAALPLLSRSCLQAEALLADFAQRCAEAGVACQTLEVIGTPFARILTEAQCVDLILLGQETHFDYGRDGEPDETLGRVLEDTPRPLVVVPRTLGGGESVVVAYDGSLQSSRALYSFESSGLGRGRPVHVVTASSDAREASRRSGRAVRFLRLHGIDAISHPVETASTAAEVILNAVRDHDAGLLVMGAYGQPVLREFFLGSATRTVLKECPVPVFFDH